MTEQRTPPIAIVGIGCRFPKASGLDQYWANIKSGLDAITDIPETHWNPADYFDEDKSAPDMTYAKRGGFLDPLDFDPLEFGITPNNIEATDTTHLLGLIAARDALLDAGYASGHNKEDGRAFNRDRCSAILGVTGTLELVIPLGARLGHPKWRKALRDAGVDSETAEDVVKRISHQYVSWQENSFPGLLGNVAAGRIANRFDLGGTNCVVDAACASSLSALHLAAMELYTGRSDMAISGGVDTFNDIFMFMCFSKTPALSPSGNSKPFSTDGDGTILGEGVGVVVMKRLEDAQRDNDKIYAILRGIGSSSDGLGNAIYAPSAQGQAKALRNAYTAADVKPSEVELVEAHGTGTKVGDRIELEALTEIYTEDNSEDCWCAVGSVKSMIGHTKAAAGVASLIKATLALNNKVLPPSIKVSKPHDIVSPGQAPLYVNTVKRPWVSHAEHKRFAALSALGFGGSNFHCVLEEASPVKEKPDWDPQVFLFSWSAGDKNALSQKLQSTLDTITENSDLRQLAAESRRTFNKNEQHKLCLPVEGAENCARRIGEAIKQLSTNNAERWTLPDGSAYAGEAVQHKLAAVFPGQGSQRCGMLRDLACQFPELLESLEAANSAFGINKAQQRLSDAIYPIPVFDKEAAAAQESHLRQTQITQPALGAVSYGSWKALQRFKINPDAFAGHSYGELVALCAAGRISENDLHALSCKRGALMAAGTGDRGSMLAVAGNIAEIEAALKAHKWDIVIANRNAPQQVVLSGNSKDISAAEQELSAQFRCRKLDVAAAFHSSYVSEAEKPFRTFLDDISFTANTSPVYANKSAAIYPDSEQACRDLLAAQLINPVAFIEEIQTMHKAGIDTFFEIGPGTVLSNLIKSILSEHNITCISLDASKGSKNGTADLARALCQLAVLGIDIDLQAWDADYEPAPLRSSKMSVKISGANYRSPVKELPPAAPKQKPAPVSASPQPAPATAGPDRPMTNHTAPAGLPSAPDPQQAALLQATQQSINALQKMQEQTALLHQQYLASQATAQNSITTLLQQQQQLFSGQPFSPVTAAAPQPLQSAVAPGAAAAPPTAPPTAPSPAPAAPTPAANSAPAPVINTAPASSPAPARPVNVSQSGPDIGAALLSIVCEKTGYPQSMLELSMHLDADLGIDSIKRVEILSALQDEVAGLPSIDADQVNQLQTLQDIVNHCQDALGAIAAQAVSAPETATQQAPTTDNSAIGQELIAIVAEKTGYPQEMLNLDMQLDADLGIDSIKRVEILSALQDSNPHLPTIDADTAGAIQTLGDIVSACAGIETTAPMTAATAVPAAANDALEQSLLEMVAEKTGYPMEMLELDMQLDADLGIDSIKRVEILSSVQERMPELPAVQADEMANLHSLRDVFNYLNTNQDAPDTAVEAAAATSPQSVPDINGIDVMSLTETLLSVVAEKTGYPREMLDVNMQLDADLGIDSIKRVEILSALQDLIPHAPVVQADDIADIQTLKHIIDHICDLGSSTQAAPPAQSAMQNHDDKAAGAASIQRLVLEKAALDDYRSHIELKSSDHCVILDDGSGMADILASELPCKTHVVQQNDVLPALDKVHACIILAHKQQDDDELFAKFKKIQQLLPLLESSQGICTALCHFGGQFGLAQCAGTAEAAAWSGIVKTISHEYPDIHCKVIDCAADLPAQRLIEEIQFQGPLEVSLDHEHKYTTQLLETAINKKADQQLLDQSDCIVISGGARGVTADVAAALATHFQCGIALLGRSALDDNEEAYLASSQDEAAIKQALIQHWSSGTPSPKAVNEQCARILAQREIRNTLERIRKTGARVHYYSADVRDPNAVNHCMSTIRTELGAISGIIHGAGVLADRLIADKTIEQFRMVWETKVHGARNLINACKNDSLKALVFFSSSTARFGRKGQCDYAAANEVLNKLAQSCRISHPACKSLSINWGPWDGGMVTPALKALFKSEGVAVINCQAGADYLCDELCSGDGPVEIVILGDDENNNNADHSKADIQYQDTQRIAYSLNISTETHPFLRSHVMNNRAVLPVAIIMEWLAHAAMHENPGLTFTGMQDLSVYKGVILSGSDTYALQFHISNTDWEAGSGYCTVEMKHDDVLHARAIVKLSDSLEPGQLSKANKPQGSAISGDPYSDLRLFHGADFQGLISAEHCDAAGIICHSQPAPSAEQWIPKPLKRQWYADPLVIDMAFQAMILWSHQMRGSASLPTRIGKYQQYTDKFPKDGCQIIARVTSTQKHNAIADIEFIDQTGQLVASMSGYECVIDPSLSNSFAKNKLAEEINS